MTPNRFMPSMVLALFLPGCACAAWVPTNGPAGQGIRGFAVDGSDLYLVHNNGANRSRNGGETWEDYAWGLGEYGLASSMVARNGAVFLGSSNGIRIRSGEGSPFIRANTGLTDTLVQCLAFAGEALLAGTGFGGVYRSRDLGAHWSRLTPMDQWGRVLGVAGTGPLILAATETGFIRSLDDGATWSRSNPDAKDTILFGLARNGSFLFAGTGSSLYRSADSGAHWTRLATGHAAGGFISLDAVGPRLYAMHINEGLFRSPDDGNTWTRDSSFFNMFNTSTVSQILPMGSGLFAAAFHGMYRSMDQGATWSGVNTGIGIGPIHSMAGFGSGRMLVASNYGLYATTDSGSRWTWLPDQARFSGNARHVFALGRYAVISVESDGLYRSSDLGATWEKWSPWPNEEFAGARMVEGDLMVTTGSGEGFRSQDSGRTWKSMKSWASADILLLAKADAGLFGTTAKGVSRFDSEQETWTPVVSAQAPPNITAFAAMGDALFAGTYMEGIFRSTDRGATWTNALGDDAARQAAGFLIQAGIVFAASDSGVAISRDTGATWIAMNAGLPRRQYVKVMLIQDGFLFVGMDSGIWKRPLSDFGPLSIAPQSPGFRSHAHTRGVRGAGRRIGFVRAGEKETDGLRDALGKSWPNGTQKKPRP